VGAETTAIPYVADFISRWKQHSSDVKNAMGLPVTQNKLDAAFNNPNPASLKSFEERGAAADGMTKRLLNSPQYKAMDAMGRVKARKQIYDNYVVPTYKAAGKDAPNEKAWLHGTKSDKLLDPLNYGGTPTDQNIALGAKASAHAIDEISLFGAKVSKNILLNKYGMGNYFIAPGLVSAIGDFSKPAEEAIHNATNKVFNKFIDSMQQHAYDDNFWMETHNRGGFWAGAAKFTGEQVVLLPLYDALEGAKVGETLTSRLGSTAKGKFVAKSIDRAFAGLAGSMVEHGRTTPTGEDVASGALFAAGGALFDKAGSWLEKVRGAKSAAELGDTAVANDAAIKKWSAEQIAMGGDPLGHATTISAAEELRTTGVAPPDRPSAAMRRANDPTLHALHEGEKLSLQSIALRHFGQSFESLDKETQDKVISRRLELMEEAKYELPVHKPELNKMEVEQSLKEQAAASPHIAQQMDILKQKFGIDLAEEVNKQQVDAIAKQTGIKSTPKAAARASKKPPVEARISPERFASHRVDTLQRFVNPFKSNKTAREKLLAMDREEFLGALEEADKNLIKFEDPLHRELFHYGNREQLPPELNKKILTMVKRELRTRFPGVDLLKKDIDSYADRAMLHLHMLAKSGRLSSEKNMFKSTNLFGAPTQFQTDLNTEVDEEEIKFLRKTIGMHPNGLTAMEAALRTLQANRATGLVTPEQWLQYDRAINMLLSGVIK
jgi:hypothetical protein